MTAGQGRVPGQACVCFLGERVVRPARQAAAHHVRQRFEDLRQGGLGRAGARARARARVAVTISSGRVRGGGCARAGHVAFQHLVRERIVVTLDAAHERCA